MKAVIAGGGIGGLAAAVALHRRAPTLPCSNAPSSRTPEVPR